MSKHEIPSDTVVKRQPCAFICYRIQRFKGTLTSNSDPPTSMLISVACFLYQVPTLPPEATIPSPQGGDQRYSTPLSSPRRHARTEVKRSPSSPSRIGPQVWGCHTPLSRKGSLSISRRMRWELCTSVVSPISVENNARHANCQFKTSLLRDYRARAIETAYDSCHIDTAMLIFF